MSRTLNIRAEDGADFSAAEVYWILRHSVYPPCLKNPDAIRMYHNIETDLGKTGNAKRNLAAKTNQALALKAPHRFTGPEMLDYDTVREHYDATITKLQAAGRLA